MLLSAPPAPRPVAIVSRYRPAAFRSTFTLGQEPEAPGDVIQDLDRVVSQSEWDRMTWTKEEAIATFNVVNLLKSIRDKVAYSAVVFREVVADPRLTGALQATEKGRQFISAANATGRWAQQLSKPNFLASLTSLQAALEINVLPRFGVAVVGTRPLFRGATIDAVKVDTSHGRGDLPEVVNFGNLAVSPLTSDLNALEAATREAETYAPEIKATMGNPPLPVLAVFIIKAAVVIGGALAVGYGVILPGLDKIAAMVKPTYADPAVLEVIEKIRETDPEKAAEMMRKLTETKQFWESAVDVAKWIAVGIGTLAAAWVLAKVVGLFGAPSGERRPQVAHR